MTIEFKWIRRGGYEVSSVGDTRFSALYATMPDGRNLESHYQLDIKFYNPGGTNWRLGKGKPPLNPNTDLWKEYLNLWKTWAIDKEDLLHELAYKSSKFNYVLSDCFATTQVNQAHALSEILNELYSKSRVLNKYKLLLGEEGVYIGRGSPWGNPFIIGKDGDRNEVCNKFEEYIKTLSTEFIEKAKLALKNKNLICYCAPLRCHGDTWLKIVNQPENENASSNNSNH